MTARDRIFASSTAGLSLVVPTLLLLTVPFDEARHVLGTVSGWSLALLTIVPSYMLLTHALRAETNLGFYKAWAGGTMGRMVVVLVAIVLFSLLVEQAPIKSFLLSFFLGYMLLTGLEVTLAVGGAAASGSPKGKHA